MTGKSQTSVIHKRLLSEVIVRDGFVRGWAFDPERPTVTVRLEGDHPPLEASTGFVLPREEEIELGRPPRGDCGFILPLPQSLFDGFPHRLTVGVAEWRQPADPPPRETRFVHGDSFGEVARDERGFTGWVAFRTPRQTPPPVVVRESETGGAALRIPLTFDPRRSREDALQTARFHLPAGALTLERPRFECAGTTLRFESKEERDERFAGSIDRIDADYFSGWAVDFDRPERAVDLNLLVDDRLIHSFRPNYVREDIAKHAKIPAHSAGTYGFRFETPAALRDGRSHLVSISCARTGKRLSGSPMTVRFPRHQLRFEPPAAELEPPPLQPVGHSAAAPPVVSVVILNRNGCEVLETLLTSWRRHGTSVPVELIVIDHDSRDGSREMLERWRSRLPLRVIALDHNDSFSASCNRGAAEARGEYLLFLNNDIVWVQDALPAMLATLDNRPVAAVGIKLIKQEQHHLQEVQHLGVRFKLVGAQYWPFEVTADDSPEENEYSPQAVPAVTGAALLCRKEAFDRVDGFDPRYFYGYEDVELCLRLSSVLGQPIVCRNDLVALHRHGHTRLTGRETTVRDHHGHNSAIFGEALGLWLKQRIRTDLLEGAGHYTREPLTIGFAVADNPAYEGDDLSLGEVGRIARRLMGTHPRCRVVALTPDRDWYAVESIHLLVVCHPGYDLTRIRGARGDLTRVALVGGELRRWRAQRWWPEFDLRLDGGLPPAEAADAGFPRFDPSRPGEALLRGVGALLRVAILVPCAEQATGDRPESWRIGEGLRQRLQRGGAAAWLVAREQWDRSPRVADVHIQLHGLTDDRYRRREDTVNILWIVAAADRLSPHTLDLFDQLWVASEAAAARLKGRPTALRRPLPAETEAPAEERRGERDRQTIELHLPGSADRRSLIAGAPGGVYEVRDGLLSPANGEQPAHLPEALFRRASTVHVFQSEEEYRDGYGSPWMWLAHRLGAEVRLSPRPNGARRNAPAPRWSPPPEEDPALWVASLRELLEERLRASQPATRESDPITRGVRAVLEGADGRLVCSS